MLWVVYVCGVIGVCVGEGLYCVSVVCCFRVVCVCGVYILYECDVCECGLCVILCYVRGVCCVCIVCVLC